MLTSKKFILKIETGRAWWLTPVIQALWRPRRLDHLRLGVQDQPDQHSETPSLKKKGRKAFHTLFQKDRAADLEPITRLQATKTARLLMFPVIV